MTLTKIVLSAALLFALPGPVHAENGENGAIIGGVIGGIIGGAIAGHGPFGPGGFGHGGPGGFGHGGPGHGGPGHGGPGFPPPHGGPGPGPGFPPPPPPGPGPGPGPVNDLCSGYFADGYGANVQLNPIGAYQIAVTALARDGGTYFGQGTCSQQNYNQATFNFQLQFGGGLHMNAGTIYRAADGRTYMQGQQDGGPLYTYSR